MSKCNANHYDLAYYDINYVLTPHILLRDNGEIHNNRADTFTRRNSDNSPLHDTFVSCVKLRQNDGNEPSKCCRFSLSVCLCLCCSVAPLYHAIIPSLTSKSALWRACLFVCLFIKIWGWGQARPETPRAWVRFLGKGQTAPSPSARGFRGTLHVSSPSGRPSGFLHFIDTRWLFLASQ